MSNHFQVFNLHVSVSAGVADAATDDIWNNIKTGLLKTIEEVCGTTQPTIGIMKAVGGKLSRLGRLVKALGHHTMQPKAEPDMHCTMLVKKQTRRSTRI